MTLVPVSVGMFYRQVSHGYETWIQPRTSGPFAGYWEFPGGKIELNESPWEALVREIHEETKVVVRGQGVALGIFPHDYEEKRVLLHVFRIPWERELADANGCCVPLLKGSSGREWGVKLLPANFSLVEHLSRSIYDT